MTDTDTIIGLRAVTNQFGTNVVHEDLSLDVIRGEILGVVGASGTGKSVLLRTIVGLITPSAGQVWIDGLCMTDASPAGRRSIGRRVGVLFQDGALFSSLTVAQNVQVPLREHLSLSKGLMAEIAALKISLVGLPPDAGPKYPADLSGGMRKRAGMARALALDPRILLLDEPTAGLDPISASAFDKLIKNISRNLGVTIFMVTHDIDTLHALCDRVAVLADRQVKYIGTISELQKVDHPWVHEYFHCPRGKAARLEER